jgi:MATE family multidrug resistance protein
MFTEFPESAGMRGAVPGVARELIGLVRSAVPIALVGIVNLGMSITDAVLMAGLDPRALTAGVVVGDVFSMAIQFAAGALGAVAAPVAAAHAAGDAKRVGRIIAGGLRMALVLALLGAAVIAIAPAVLRGVGVRLPLPEVASEYALYMAATYAVMMVVALSRSIFPAFGGGVIVLVVILAALPLNLAADLVLMHGWLGLPAMGLAGAGAASLLVAVFMATVLLICLARTSRLGEARVWRAFLSRNDGFVGPALARAGIFTGATALCETGVYLSSTVIVAFVAIEAVPAHILVFRTVAITYVIGTGFAQAVTIRLARGLATGIGESLRKAVALGAITLAALFVLVMLALPSASQAAGIAAPLAHVLAPFAAVAVCNLVPAVVAFGILKARADVGVPSLISFGGYWGVGFALVIVLAGPLGLGAVGVWIALATGTTATAAGLWAYLRRRDGWRPGAASPAM